ncbi:MAG: hypothetical protein BZ137_00620 [Methanosphaera sp. rholeuAM130]|nr:MAG: hypothetical protein BZ137_00620 [Methanosphaera sp. rholeuAM130]
MTYVNSNQKREYHNDELYNIFDLIQTPLNKSHLNKNKQNTVEVINYLDLNIANMRKYYPKITRILKNNEFYKEDLLHDFMKIRSMSIYIFDYLEKITDNKYNSDLYPYLNIIYDYMRFVDILLDDFHNVLIYKNNFVREKISYDDYSEEYLNYKRKLNQNRNLFYEKIYKNNEYIDTDTVKKIWSKEYVKGEYKYK